MSEIEDRGFSCPEQDRINEYCSCPKTDCKNHGICCRCILDHKNRIDVQYQINFPHCLRDLLTKTD